MTGKEMTELVENDRFAAHVGIELVTVGIDFAEAKMEIMPFHINGAGRVQGGALFTLADFTFAAASNAAGILTTGINVSISYLSAPKGAVVTAQAREVSAGNRICVYDVEVFDEDGMIVAKFIGTGYRKKQN